MKSLFIGMMSGTSMDGIDAGLFEIKNRDCTRIAADKYPYPPELRRELIAASRNPAACNLDALGRLDQWVGERFLRAAEQLIAASKVARDDIRAIGSHGQTIRHQPRAARPFTLQIGDPNLLAAGTGITTVADFRRRDLALGGEGAPLAPAFHNWLWAAGGENRVVLNIGGIANITILPARRGTVSGFDTGPGNTLLDAWIQSTRKQDFDADGSWSDSGRVAPDLLDALLGDAYFDAPPPKSTGFEYFNLNWLAEIVGKVPGAGQLPAEDIQATLSAATAGSIAAGIRSYAPATERVLVCGGGVHNGSLMRRLKETLGTLHVASTAEYGIDPDWVEAAAFAWLAKRCLERKPGNLPAVTGAARETVLGGIYWGADARD